MFIKNLATFTSNFPNVCQASKSATGLIIQLNGFPFLCMGLHNIIFSTHSSHLFFMWKRFHNTELSCHCNRHKLLIGTWQTFVREICRRKTQPNLYEDFCLLFYIYCYSCFFKTPMEIQIAKGPPDRDARAPTERYRGFDRDTGGPSETQGHP